MLNKLSPELLEQHPPVPYSVRWLIVSLAAIICIAFSPYIFGGKTFLPSDLFDTMTSPFNAEYGPPQAQNHYIFDGLAQTYPYKLLTKEALLQGKLAYWNPRILGGYPQYAESLANNFDPFNVLLLWFDPVNVIHLQTIFELFIAGIGMLLLLRFFRISPLINLTFAAGYMLNSLFITTAHNRSIIAALCWIPFVVLMILRYFNSTKKEDLFYASIFLALVFLDGTFQTSFYAAFIAGVIALWYPTITKVTFVKRLTIILSVGVSAFALSAIMWLPSLELFFEALLHGGRFNASYAGVDYTIVQRLLSVPFFLITFFLPGVVGNAQTYNLKKYAGLDIMYFNGAIGFIPILFALWGCYALRNNKTMRPFIMVAVLGILLPIATPLFSFLYHRFFVLASFAFCVIGAVAFDLLIHNSDAKKIFAKYFFWVKIFFCTLTAGLIAIWAYIALNYQSVLSKFTLSVLPKISGSAFGTGNESWMLGRVAKTLDYYSSFSASLWLPIIGAALTIFFLIRFFAGKLSKRILLSTICIATVMELVVFTQTWFPSIDMKKFPVYPQNAVTSFLQSDSTSSRYSIWRDAAVDPYLLASNASNVYNISDFHGYESITNRSMLLLSDQFIHPDSMDFRLLGLLNVKYILIHNRIVNSPNLRKVFFADSMTVYQNLLCKPRAYITHKTTIVSNDSTVANKLLRSDFDGSQALFTKEDAPSEMISSVSGKDSIHFNRSENEEVEIIAETDSKGIFILTDTYYPGWKCYINGKETPIHRVNYCMRGIVLDVGKSTIVFKFEPDIFKAGAAISTFALFLCLAGIPILKRRDKRKNEKANSTLEPD